MYVCLYVCMYVCIYAERWEVGGWPPMRGRRSTAEMVLFEASNSMEPYPSVCFMHIPITSRPLTGFLSQNFSMRFLGCGQMESTLMGPLQK